MKNFSTMAGLLLLVASNSWSQLPTTPESPQLSAPPTGLSLSKAVAIARQQDPWLQGSLLRQQALSDKSIAAATLPDIEVSLSVSNLPVDTFNLGQEPMTQLRVGLNQKFPRGSSLTLRQQRLRQMSQRQPFQRQHRRAQVEARVAEYWLDAYLAKASIELIEADRELFEYLVDVTKSNYSSALLKTHQQDFIRAQLELTRLDDRLVNLDSNLEQAKEKLNQWLLGENGELISNWVLAGQLPQLPFKREGMMAIYDNNLLSQKFSQHPVIKDLQQKHRAMKTSVGLAKQKYKPAWNVSAVYGQRSDDPSGRSRSDLLTVGIGFDLPFFTENKQDRELSAAKSYAEAIRTEKALAMQKLVSGFNTQRAKLTRLEQRQKIYRERLLIQMSEQAQASLNAYTNDSGDFAEVVRARIAEMNARIESLSLAVKSRQAQAQINYYLSIARAGE